MKYFFDNCLSYRFAAMLRALDVDAVALRDRFPAETKDVDVFRELRDSGYVFITTDARQATRDYEAKALKESGITALFFGKFWSRRTLWQQAVWLISRWERIDHFASSVQVGTCADIRENGKARPFQL
ncbi:MAG: DUF5615 family PIN-like protein [Pirellulales bacterium]